jgi:hypothetical protein
MQCTIGGATSSASGAGNTLTLTLGVLFYKSSFGGAKTIWGLAQDATTHSGWQSLGSFTVQ